VSVDLGGKTVLVTGGTGFIGGRLVERLSQQCGANVRALVRNFMKAPRLARFDVQMVPGDASVQADVERAAEGCDVIFHCAYGNSGDDAAQRHGTLGSTQYVLDAAQKNGARVVNVSTVAVYGTTPDGDLDESAPRAGGGDAYSDSKLAAEQLCVEYTKTHGVPTATVQPTIVYGPFGPAWTLRIFNDLSTWRVILPDGGTGLCNAVYVDDVVSSMLLCAVRDEAVGEIFLVSAAEPVTWREFFERNAAAIGVTDGTIELPLAEAEGLWEEQTRKRGFVEQSIDLMREDEMRWRVGRTLEASALLRMASRVTPWRVKNRVKTMIRGASTDESNEESNGAETQAAPVEEKPIQVMPPVVLQMLASKTRARIDKARRLLGYEPAFDFAAGMERTAGWAQWAQLAADASEEGGSA
jgi:nucleoside-diphosphate-sugar epimerase